MIRAMNLQEGTAASSEGGAVAAAELQRTGAHTHLCFPLDHLVDRHERLEPSDPGAVDLDRFVLRDQQRLCFECQIFLILNLEKLEDLPRQAQYEYLTALRNFANAVNETGALLLRFHEGLRGIVRLRNSPRCRIAGHGRPNRP